MKAWRHTGLLMGLALAMCFAGCDDDGGDGTDAGPMTDSGPEVETDAGPEATNTIVDIAAGDPRFSMLVEAAQRAELVELLSGTTEFTVFAPTNDAFMASGITDVSTIPAADLRGILTYHALPGRVTASMVQAGPATTGAMLTLFLGTEGGVTINGGNTVMGGANVVDTDIIADNGVIHVIDRVLTPPDIPTLATYGGLTGLLGAVTTAANVGDTPVAEVLAGDGPFTVFAPTNDAFTAAPSGLTPEELRDVLLYHVVGAAVPSTAVPAMADSSLQNAYGNNVTLMFDTTSGVVVNGATVQVADLLATNGVVHVIDAVLIPPNVVDMVGIAGLSSLEGAVTTAAPLTGGTTVAEALAAQEPYTVFAPTDDAFSRAPAGLSATALRDVLLLHVVNAGAPVLSDGIPATAESLNGTLTFDTAASPPTVAGPGGATGGGVAPINTVDIHVTNGVIHVIGEVILPAAG